MKKYLLCIITILGMLCSYSAFADSDITVMMEGNIITFPDAQPFIDENDRTQVPVRPIAEAAGCSVSWDEGTQTVSLYSDTLSCDFTIGSNIAVIKSVESDGTSYGVINMDTEALIAADRTYIPVTYLAQALDKTTDWDGETQTVNIRSFTDEDLVYSAPNDTGIPAWYFADGYTDGSVPEYLTAALSRSNVINGVGLPTDSEEDTEDVNISDCVFKMSFAFLDEGEDEEYFHNTGIMTPMFEKCDHLAVHVETDSEPVWLTVSVKGINDEGAYFGWNSREWHKYKLSKDNSVTVDFNDLDPTLRYCVVVEWTFPTYTPDVKSVNGIVSVAAY